MKKIRIGHVDDEKVARSYICRMKLWTQEGFTLVFSAESGREALEKLKHEPIDILLMDVSMPDMDGIELSRQVREAHPETDIIALSNFDGYDYVTAVLKNGAKDYLLKHRINEDSLRSALEAVSLERENKRENKSILRERLRNFVLKDASWPLLNDGSQNVACFVTTGPIHFGQDSQRKTVQDGMEMLLEGEAGADMDRIAVAFGDNSYLLLFRLYNCISHSEILRRVHLHCAIVTDNIHSIYHVPVQITPGLVMHNQEAFIAFIRRRIHLGEDRHLPVSHFLPLAQQQRLINQLEGRDTAGLKATLQDIFREAESRNLQEKLFHIRSVIDILRTACRDWNSLVSLPPEGNALFVWMNSMTFEKLLTEVQHLYEQVVMERGLPDSPHTSETVQAALKYLEEHYHQRISLSDIAAGICVNEAHLSRVFKKEMNITVMDYLAGYRIDKAKELLKGGCSLKQVSAEVGFVQYTHFLRVFKEITGKTPTQFLKNQ